MSPCSTQGGARHATLLHAIVHSNTIIPRSVGETKAKGCPFRKQSCPIPVNLVSLPLHTIQVIIPQIWRKMVQYTVTKFLWRNNDVFVSCQEYLFLKSKINAFPVETWKQKRCSCDPSYISFALNPVLLSSLGYHCKQNPGPLLSGWAVQSKVLWIKILLQKYQQKFTSQHSSMT